MLLDMGYQIICPDLMGFGGTVYESWNLRCFEELELSSGQDAPKVPPESMALYSFKRAADDIVELARRLKVQKFILGGHDWYYRSTKHKY